MTKFYIDQHGCAKNQTDGEVLSGCLEKAGFEFTQDAASADFIIVNSCGFIESAKKESLDAIYSIKTNYPNVKIILAGCLAERYAKSLEHSMPELDGIFGNGDLSKIVDFMRSVQNGSRKVEVYKQEGVCVGERLTLFNFKGSAFVKITEGCSNHCTFCAIPIIRGELRSRPADSVLEEIKSLIKNGVYEINLIGQDLAAYGTGKTDINIIDGDPNKSPLARLLEKISSLEGNFLVRLLYIHPDHFNLDILPIMKADNRFARYFDIPFQSGDDNIILKMNRKGSKEKYENLIRIIRQELENCVIRTTFLTGFPGESKKAFLNTKDFLENIKPDWSGCFPYSREEDTPAYSMNKRVFKKISAKRAMLLESCQSEITQERLSRHVGKEYEVLVEEVIEPKKGETDDIEVDLSEGIALGRSWFQAPEVDGCVVIRYDRDEKLQLDCVKAGNIIKVKVLSVAGVDLDARFVGLVKDNSDKNLLKFINI